MNKETKKYRKGERKPKAVTERKKGRRNRKLNKHTKEKK
jgi:hypothetical protein